ncbi:MAG: hypothetical protein J6T74_02770 [Clostridia bacterium]|nr:hypothetical protein [Clostridia bacterium]
MKLITEIKLKPGFLEQDLIKAMCEKAKIKPNDIKKYEIIKQGIDARKKPNVFCVLNVAIDCDVLVSKKLSKYPEFYPDHSLLNYDIVETDTQPVIVGFGPAGMFCALALSRAGLKPIVLEQGRCVEERQKDVEEFWNNRVLNKHSNVQYGEGGAGTFSDGKLNTSLNNEYCKKIINELIFHGAPKEIYYKNKPHIGTDNLKIVVKNIREEIIKNGGKIIFNAYFCDFLLKNNKITSIFYKNIQSGKLEEIKTNMLILALGHSSLNTFKMLKEKDVKLIKKPFAVGVRIEHEQDLINKAQYGAGYDKNLPPADYKLVEHLPNGRSVFTFCMCPGGQVVASSSEEGGVVTNGMSEFSRSGKYANSALLVNVNPDDFGGEDILSGFYFQRELEKNAFDIAGKNYNAPAELVGDFIDCDNKNAKKLHKNEQKNNFLYNDVGNFSTYRPSITFCDLSNCLPNFVSSSLCEGIVKFDNKIKGFANPNALLIGVETRSSCPVQAVREKDYVCTYEGLYMCGEGAGFAGGIISSAVDGVKCAENIINKLSKKQPH